MNMRGRQQRRSTAPGRRGRLWLAGMIALSTPAWPLSRLMSQEPILLAPLPLQPQSVAGAPNVKLTPFCLPTNKTVTGTGTTRATDLGAWPHPVLNRSEEPVRTNAATSRGTTDRAEATVRTVAEQHDTTQDRKAAVAFALSDSSDMAATNVLPSAPILAKAGRVLSLPAGPENGEGERLTDAIPAAKPPTGSPLMAEAAAEPTAGANLVFEDNSDPGVDLSLSDHPVAKVPGPAVVGALVEPATAPNLDSPEPTGRPAWRGESEVKTTTAIPLPTLTKIPTSGRILPVPALGEPGQVIESLTDRESVPNQNVADRQRRIIHGARPMVDVSVPPVAIERGHRSGANLLEFAADRKTDNQASETSASVPSGGVVAAAEAVLGGSGKLAGNEHSSNSTADLGTAVERSVLAASAIASMPRGASDKSTVAPAANSSGVHLSLTSDPAAEVVGRLSLQPTEVRSITVKEPIRRFHSDAPNVCTALASQPGKLQLIATGEGVTRLTLELGHGEGETRRVAYEVTVGGNRSAGFESSETLAQKMNETVALAFPHVNARVLALQDRLEIVGTMPDEATAKRILRMVRSACPVAVNDRLTVR